MNIVSYLPSFSIKEIFSIFFASTLKKTEQLTDVELIEEYIATQKQQHFSVLYTRYSDKVYRKCLFLLKNDALAKDATQDIFIKLLSKLSTFNYSAKFSTWIYSVTYNHCIDLIRKQKRTRTSEMDDHLGLIDDNFQELEDERLFKIEVDRLKSILEEISPTDKATLLMKYQDDMSIREIAQVLDKGESAIKMKLKRAKEKVKIIYKNNYKKTL